MVLKLSQIIVQNVSWPAFCDVLVLNYCLFFFTSFGHTPPKMKIPLVPLQPKTITRNVSLRHLCN